VVAVISQKKRPWSEFDAVAPASVQRSVWFLSSPRTGGQNTGYFRPLGDQRTWRFDTRSHDSRAFFSISRATLPKAFGQVASRCPGNGGRHGGGSSFDVAFALMLSL
jgi:hypothetical protein